MVNKKEDNYWMLEREFHYYCLINLFDYGLNLINAKVTKRSEQVSALYGQWVTEGKPTLSGFKEFDKKLKRLIRKITSTL